MQKTAVHSFSGGMVKDLDKSLITNDRYLEARNFRLVTSTGVNNVGESSGSLENIEGNALVISSIPNTMHVAGSVYLRDTVVLFLTTNTTTVVGGRNMIVSFTIDTTTEELNNYTVLYDDNLNASAGELDFSTIYPIRAAAVYEAPNIQKIYWCDGYNNMRYANIASYLTTDGLIKSGSNSYFTPDLFEFLPGVNLTTPELDYIIPGDIHAGMVQYAFQYFTQHGAETTMSPLSNVIHITNKDDYSAYSFTYKGEGNLTSSAGKGVRLNIDVNDSYKYNYIRVVRLHYTTVNSVPTITVVGEVNIDSSVATVSFTDTGSTTLGSLTLDKFNIGNTELFSAKDVAVKNERLFAANIVKDEFTLGNWDSRAVRFKSSDATARLRDILDGDLTITQPASDTVVGWNNANWGSYTKTHDGINYFNNPAYDGNTDYQYRYQRDGAVLGAEGPNIKIGFEVNSMIIDSSKSDYSFYVGTEYTTDNKSYTSFASPYLAGKRSWQRDETYRLYIVFFDKRGRSSKASWICDLRMPSLHEFRYSSLASLSSSNVKTDVLYPTVYLKSMPENAVKAQILRVQRGGQDRSIITQALVIPVNSVESNYVPRDISTAIDNTGGIVKLVSPEINIYNNIGLESSDYLEYVSRYTTTTVSGSGSQMITHKCEVSTPAFFTSNVKTNIEETQHVTPTDVGFIVSGISCVNYYDGTGALNEGFGSSGLFVRHGNKTWSPAGSSYVVANYKRDVHRSQYGGQTYESRSGNIAIPASEVFEGPGSIQCLNGDTFINFFDVSTKLYNLEKGISDTGNETVYIPLESSINTELRHDNSMRTEVTSFYHWNMQETAGKWENANGEVYIQSTPLYQYNTVYSQESNANYYINVPDLVSTQTDFDCMIKVSGEKHNSESQDSWTLFPVNDFIEVNTKSGPLTTLVTLNNKLLFWQTDAFGVLSVRERSLIQDGEGALLVLGTGGILDRYDYVSDKVGVHDNRALTTTQTGIYWVNTLDSSIYRFTDSLVNLSKSKMLQSLGDIKLGFDSRFNLDIRTVYDIKYNCILFTVFNQEENVGTTICYDENIDSFSSFYDYYTYNYIPFRNGYLSTGEQLNTPYDMYYHNSKISNRCYFYGKYVDSSIKIVFNEEFGYTKVFDSLFYSSDVSTTDVTTDIPRSVLVYNDTFNTLRCYNSFQNTDYVTLTYGTNLERDERDWTTYIPRNAVSVDYISNPFIFDSANLDTTRKFRERMRDKFMVTDLIYTNANNKRIVIPYVGVKYRISPR